MKSSPLSKKEKKKNEEEAVAELQFPLFLYFLQSLVQLLAQIKEYFLFHNHFLTYSLLQFYFIFKNLVQNLFGIKKSLRVFLIFFKGR